MPTPISLSASRGAAVLGLSPWKTQVQAWLEIMEQREPGFCDANDYLFERDDDNPMMRWGKAFESAIIELAEYKQNMKIWDRETLYNCPELKYLTCHIDGAYNEQEIGILHEGKTTSEYYYRENFGEPGSDVVPIDYQIQCQHQMICTGAEKVILSVLVFPKRVEEWEEMGIIPMKQEIEGFWFLCNPQEKIIDEPRAWAYSLYQMGYFHQYHIPANPELQSLMLEKYKKFWTENIIGKTPPTPSDMSDIKKLCRTPHGTVVLNEDMERLASELNQIRDEIGAGGSLAKRAEQIKVILMEYARNTGGITDDDSHDKYIFRDRAGKKVASYGKNKNGVYSFR